MKNIQIGDSYNFIHFDRRRLVNEYYPLSEIDVTNEGMLLTFKNVGSSKKDVSFYNEDLNIWTNEDRLICREDEVVNRINHFEQLLAFDYKKFSKFTDYNEKTFGELSINDCVWSFNVSCGIIMQPITSIEKRNRGNTIHINGYEVERDSSINSAFSTNVRLLAKKFYLHSSIWNTNHSPRIHREMFHDYKLYKKIISELDGPHIKM
jgi:hypothetical protein